MNKPLIISTVLHVAILVATLVVIPSTRDLPPVPRVLPVELLTIKDVTNLKRKAPTPVEEPKPIEEEKPKVSEVVPEPEPEPDPEPKVEAAPTPPEKEQPKPEPEKKAEVKEEPKPVQKPAPSKKPDVKKSKREFDPNALAKLLNKIPDDAAPKQETKTAEVKDNSSPTTDDPNAELSMSEMDAFKQRMAQCWNPPAGAPANEDLTVLIKVSLNQDGTVQRAEIADSMKMFGGSTYYRASAEAAVRAIKRCAPYNFLPQDSYNRWKELELNFDPRLMMGG